MLPFSSLDFFLLSGIFVALLWLVKAVGQTRISLSQMLLGISVAYIILYYPKPWHLALLVGYSYGMIYLLLHVFKWKNKLLGSLLLLLPMLLVKADIRFHFYPFDLNRWISFAGLSYICFRILSVYLEHAVGDKLKNFWQYCSYLLFVPTLLIGPIDRYNRFTKDTEEGWSRISSKNMLEGWQMIAFGLLHKFVLAEAVSRYWMSTIDVESVAFLDMANSMYAYFFYLYFDFAGYSALAIGLGKMMGIDVPINFNKPFLSRNPQEFWKRWHKSLGDWLGDYFFKPFYLFLSRKKSLKKNPLLRQNVSLFLTFFLMGCWNGFEFNYILSGSIFGLMSVGHNSYIFYSRKKGRDIVFGNLPDPAIKWISILLMFHLSAFSIYIFSGRIPFW